MTQEEKDLLIKDLSARLMYKVKFSFNLLDEEKQEVVNTVCTIFSVNTDGYCEALEVSGHIPLDFAKPYLRPMSSMTVKEKTDLLRFFSFPLGAMYFNPDWGYVEVFNCIDEVKIYINDIVGLIDWLNKNMFDYRYLISKGLALKANDNMYNI